MPTKRDLNAMCSEDVEGETVCVAKTPRLKQTLTQKQANILKILGAPMVLLRLVDWIYDNIDTGPRTSDGSEFFAGCKVYTSEQVRAGFLNSHTYEYLDDLKGNTQNLLSSHGFINAVGFLDYAPVFAQ